MYQGAIIKSNASSAQDQTANVNNTAKTHEPTAQEILEQANLDAENIRQKAMLEAKQERDVILEQAQIAADEKVASHILQLSQDYRNTVRQQETKIGRVVSNTLRQIISDIPSQTLQRDVLKTALRNFADDTALTIKVPPASFDQVWWANWKWAMDNNFDVNTIIKDPNLEEGRCVLEFADHKIDIGIKTQLDSIEQLATGRTNQQSAQSVAKPDEPAQQPNKGE